jgi:hypothetical protein
MKMQFGPSVLSLAKISTIPDHQGTDEVTIGLPGSGIVRATGNVVVQPLGLEGDITVENLQLKSLWPLMEPYFEFTVDKGVAAARLHYAVSAPESGIRATVTGFENTVRDLSLIDLGERIVDVRTITVKDGRFRWPEAEVGVGLFRVERPVIVFRREVDGRMSVERMVPKKTREVARETYREVEEAAKWTVDVAKFEVVDSVGRFVDRTFEKPVEMEAKDIQLAITGFTTRPGKQWTVVSSATFPRGATTKTNGKASLGPPTFESEISLSDFDLTVPQPYIELFAPLEISGKAATSGKLAGGIDPQKGPWVKFVGDGEIKKMELRETVVGSTPLKWETVRARGIEAGYGPLLAGLKSLDIRGAVIDVVVSEQGKISLLEVKNAMAAKKRPTEEAPPPPQEKTTATADVAPLVVRLDAISLKNCSAGVTDRRIGGRPPFSMGLDKIEGSVKGISSTTKTPASFQIGAAVRGGGILALKGKTDPFDPFRATDFTLDLQKVEIPPMSPMSVHYVGYPVAKGYSVLGFQYDIKSKKVTGKNHLMTQDLTLGDKVEGKGKVGLPVKLGISLLTDAEGRITIDFPIDADFNDPKFAITSAIGSAVKAVTAEAVKSPFRLLSKLGGGGGGGDGDDQGYIDFAPGSAELDAASAERLKTLASGLGKRPQIRLVVAGVWNETADAPTLREAALEKQLAQRGAKDAAAPSLAELEALYKEAAGPEKVAALRQSHTAASTEGAKPSLDEGAYEDALREAILASQSVGAAEFQALGEARAAAVRSAFVEQGGLDASRLEMGAARAVTGTGESRVRLSLEVAGAAAAQAAKAE